MERGVEVESLERRIKKENRKAEDLTVGKEDTKEREMRKNKQFKIW